MTGDRAGDHSPKYAHTDHVTPVLQLGASFMGEKEPEYQSGVIWAWTRARALTASVNLQAIQGNLSEVISSPTETHLTNTSFSGDFEDLIRKVPN